MEPNFVVGVGNGWVDVTSRCLTSFIYYYLHISSFFSPCLHNRGLSTTIDHTKRIKPINATHSLNTQISCVYILAITARKIWKPHDRYRHCWCRCNRSFFYHQPHKLNSVDIGHSECHQFSFICIWLLLMLIISLAITITPTSARSTQTCWIAINTSSIYILYTISFHFSQSHNLKI